MTKKQDAPVPLEPMEQVSPSLSPTATLKNQFSPMLQGTATNTLAKTSLRKNPPQVDAVTGLATISEKNGFTVFIEGYNQLEGGLRVSTHKLLDLCTLNLTQQNDYRGNGAPHTLVSIALDDYMDALGIPHTKASKDKARRRVKEDLETLFSTSLEWSEPVRGELRDFSKTRICTTVGIQRGRIVIDFTPAFTQYLTHSYIMQYPRAILQISEKFTSSYHLGRKLLLHHSMQNNQRKGTSGIISVRSLLENAPELPSFEQVRGSDRAYARRIIEPFERDMNAMDSFLHWEYCQAKGAPLTQEQRQNFTYDIFIACYIQFTVDNFPNPQGGKSRQSASKAK